MEILRTIYPLHTDGTSLHVQIYNFLLLTLGNGISNTLTFVIGFDFN